MVKLTFDALPKQPDNMHFDWDTLYNSLDCRTMDHGSIEIFDIVSARMPILKVSIASACVLHLGMLQPAGTFTLRLSSAEWAHQRHTVDRWGGRLPAICNADLILTAADRSRNL
jgi:hypothetical protein